MKDNFKLKGMTTLQKVNHLEKVLVRLDSKAEAKTKTKVLTTPTIVHACKDFSDDEMCYIKLFPGKLLKVSYSIDIVMDVDAKSITDVNFTLSLGTKYNKIIKEIHNKKLSDTVDFIHEIKEGDIFQVFVNDESTYYKIAFSLLYLPDYKEKLFLEE